MDQLKALKYFVEVVNTGSFTKAAKAFGVPPSSLSRRVADLEEALGATLLKRTTRTVSVTEIGRMYFEQISSILMDLAASNEAVSSYQSTPMGQLKISAMTGFGETILMPLMDEFSELYPEVVLDITLSDTVSTLSRDDVDIAIRGGYAPNERVIAIELMNNNFIPAASPQYLEKHGTPTHPLELKTHKGLYYRTPVGPTPWICTLDGQRHDVSAPAAAISNAGKWLVNKALKHQGILMVPRWVLKPYLDEGSLVELNIRPQVSITENPNFGVFLLYQKQRYLVPKIKAAVDFLVARVKA
ncbi:LysR family transcriptional regulator [Litoribacillus peritrichatus]|uniref:LysR family transcriptional regulator n=1 Tax=Litoribacillus peritrichatus TaxID=718191 RepID=A0ABP7N318_9GAMM